MSEVMITQIDIDMQHIYITVDVIHGVRSHLEKKLILLSLLASDEPFGLLLGEHAAGVVHVYIELLKNAVQLALLGRHELRVHD
jgi:hypothetical protein